MLKKSIPFLFIAMIVYEISPFKKMLSELLIQHQILITYSWFNFLCFTLIFSLVLLPFQSKFYGIIHKMQLVNNVFIENDYKMTTDVVETINKLKIPTKNKIMLLLFLNVIVYGLFISIISEFKLNILFVVFLPIAIVFGVSSYVIINKFARQKINNNILKFLVSIIIPIMILLYVKKEIILFVTIQSCVVYIYGYFDKRKKKFINK